jgi:hypothetical protein
MNCTSNFLNRQILFSSLEVSRLRAEYFDEIAGVARLLMNLCKKENWAGYDPYDALNSRLFALIPFAQNRLCRIAFTQIIKRLPVNIRPYLSVRKEKNPKALALFLSASIKMAKAGLQEGGDAMAGLAKQIEDLRSPGNPYWCWGYCFPWQTRTVLVPRWEANLVSTTFVANALLDAYEHIGEVRYLEMATSSALYILNELFWKEGDSVAGFSYPLPSLRARVHNANFLGAALLARVYKYTADGRFLDPALKAARYSAGMQHADGSWNYGERSTQRWVDNFHTGYNLCALRRVCDNFGTDEFEPHIIRGFEFYRRLFFREDGAPKYFHDRTYPIDIHSVAQSIITLITLKDLHEEGAGLALSVYEWAMRHMRSEQGWFYYQVLPHYTNRLSFMRWSQAWMLLALSFLLEECGHNGPY